MSLFEEIVKAWDAKDFDTLAAGMHEDFIWMDGYDVKTLDEWLPGLKHEMVVALNSISFLAYSKMKTSSHINIL